MPEKYFQYLVLHVKHFPEKLSKTLPNKSKSKQKQINCNPRTNHCDYLNQIIKKKNYTINMNNPIKTKILVWGSVLREKKGGRWVGGGGSARTRDGLVEVGWGGRRMGQWREKREEEERSVKLPTPAEWLAWTMKGAMGRRLILGFTSGTLSFILGLGLAWMMRVSSSGLLFGLSLSLSLSLSVWVCESRKWFEGKWNM